MANYDPNTWYRFTDKDGNEFTSRGDNGYVWQSMTEGIPISVNSEGNWYTEPYLDVSPSGYVAHIPNWFKQTNEYSQWQDYASQIPNLSVDKTVFDNLNNILKTLGSQGALRTSLTQDIKSYGVTNQELIDKYVKDIVSMAAEGQGGGKAQINLWGTDYNSAADIARHYKELSKEDLSSAMTSMYDIMDKGQKGEWTDDEKYLADAVTSAKILNYVDDNHTSFGENDEFNGLLSSSALQQINRGLTQFMGGVTSNTFVGIPARLAYATLNNQYGNGDFNLRIEDLFNDRLATGSDLGAGLEGNEAADVVGMWGGAIGSIAVTMAASMTMGSAINAKVATSAPEGFLAKVGTFAQTIPGSAVSDFFLNDVPLDLMMFTTDSMRDGVEKAWYDPENPQPLFGVPFIRQSSDGNFYPSGVGPDVPGGLAMNLVGDAVLDAAVPFLSIVGNATYKGLDNITGGAITRVREKAELLNLQIQQKLTDIPILGTGWQKFVNHMMGAENAQFIREARKAAIAEGSMEPYVRAQNLLTLSNHSGMEVVQPLYKQIDSDLGISKTIKDFNKQANDYGGVGETRVEWKEIKKGRTENLYKVVPDTIPKQVKQGLLDVERLSELKGEMQNEGGLIPNPARKKEITEIEARLEKTPQAIKDFAEKFSELNKRVEAMRVDLDLTTQDWIDSLRADPRWESYMTRQALTIGNQTISSGTNPPDAKIITAKRKGYYSENYIDPTLALGMKVEALGRAFAWNERAKAMVGFEISQGKVIAGKAGVDVAARLAEVKQEIKNSVEYRKAIGYDDTLKSVNKDVTSVSDAFKKVNGLLNLPEKLSLKSVYEATQNPAIKEFISDFNKGEIKFAEGVKEAAGLSDSDAATIIQNTYVQKGGEAKVVAEVKQDIKTFDDLMADFDNMLSVQKIGDTYKQYQNRAWSEEGANFLFDMKNEAGETDFGIYGISEWAREKIVDDIDQKINAAEKEFKESGQWQEYASWVSTLGDKKLSLREAERNLVNNNKSKKALKDYDEKLADYESWYSKRPIGDVTEIDSVARLLAIREQLYMGYPMINTESFVDSKPVISFYGDGKYKEGGFQNLTRGEIRRALYEKGYDNITNKEFKEAIDKADNSFTQRTTQPMILYRGETADTARNLKVGDKVDSASWTYTAFTPKYTDLYREGITNKKPSGKKAAYDDKGVVFRYHLETGSPVYVPHKDMMGDWYNQNVNKFKIPTATQEFVLPRNIDGTIVSITKDAKLFSDGSEGNYVTVVDVVVDPNTGIAPKLQTQAQRIGEAEGFDLSFRNSAGEIDVGINGLTEKGRKQLRRLAEQKDMEARAKWSAERNEAYNAYKAKHDEWLDGMRSYVEEGWKKLSPKQQDADPLASKLYDQYRKKNPEPEFTDNPEYPRSVETDWIHREMASSMSENLVDSEATLDNKIIAYFDRRNKDVYNENNFNYLTRGEIRHKLIDDGYNNLDAKTKRVVDKADNAFTQRMTDNTVLYRAEPTIGNPKKTPKVGDKIDSSSWTYTHLLPQETEVYREGATIRPSKAFTDIRTYLPGMPSGILYRYHTPEGTPVFHKKAWQGKGTTAEFVLPRDMEMTVTAVSRGGRDSKFSPFHGRMVIVDVEVNPNTGVTPRLQTQKIGDGTRKVSWTQEEWDAWNQIDRTLSNMESFELAAKGSHAGILDLRKKLEETARGQRYKGQPYVAALKQQAIDGLKELGVPTHLIEKIEVPYRLADANIPDTATSPVRTKLEEKAAAAGYSAGVTSEGIPYKYTVENGEITSFERLESSEDYAMATSMLGGVYSMSASTVDRIGKINAAAVNRTILYYRDNMPNIGTGPTFFFDGSSGSWGYIWPATYTSQYGWRLENGKIVAEQYPVFMGHSYRAGNEEAALRSKQAECESGFKPKNTGTLESTPTHESGHSLMMQLAVHRLNRMAEEGTVKLPEGASEIGQMVEDAYDNLHALLIDRAMKKLGYEKYTEADIFREANTISEYASSTNYGKDKAGRWKHDEIFSEAQRMYQGNGDNSSPFCLAIVEEMKTESERFTTAAAPGEVFAKNNLTAPKGLFKDDQYAFPAKAKTAKQKAKWLDDFRQNNPYIKGKGLLTEENYQLANLWDTFFQKEIRAYDPKNKSSMPDLLAKKNGDFIEDLSKNAAKRMVEEIKKASVEGFSQDLATMVLSRNSGDVTSAMNNFIVGRVNKAAEAVAAKMPGGATEENINTARMTMWSEDTIKNDFITMLSALSPDIDGRNITSKVNELFDTQAKGYASFEALPVDTKKLIGEQEKLTEKLYKENNYARKKGKEVDQELTGYRGDVTQVIHYKAGGEDVYVVVSDPVIAEVLKKPSNYKETGVTVEAIASAANFISRSYRIGTTGANPIAFVRNVLRDPLQATIQGGFNPLNMSLSPEVFYHTLRGFGLDDATINNVTQRLRTWASSGTLTSEMRNMGIDTPATLGYRNRVEKVSKKLRNPNSKLNKVVERAEAPLETWESMFRNQIAQQSFVKNYRRTGDVNKAMGAALFDASNSTTNFSHSVGMFSRATSTIPYLSSAINGTRSFWVQFNADPVGMITRITTGFMVPAMAITAWNLSSQERREAYMNLPEWYKSGHLVLIDLEGNTIAFPIPEELGQYFNTTRKLVEFTQEATPYGIGQILSQGAFGFLPVDMDGFYGEDGSIQIGRGVAQLVSGILPQAATAIYEFAAEKDLFTGQDLSDYNAFQKWINLGTNILGTGFKNVVNDIGFLVGASPEFRLGKTTADTLARDLFGVGFDNVKSEFMNLVGNPSEIDPVTKKETAATGLFAENEKLQRQIEGINAQIAYSSDDKKAELENQKQTLITDFTERVSNLVNKYMNLYTQTGGLEEWQKEKIVKLLTLGRSSSSADSGSYQSASSSEAYLNERALAQQRYVEAGLPAGPSLEALGDNGSIELQAAINRFYGVNKQATQDFKNVVEDSSMKDVKDEFYAVIQQIYDAADEQGLKPDYDLIERIQARYLQMMDAALIPIINEYGVGVLNNSDFIDAVRKQVSGMIPSDDWRQSARNAKKFLSTKDFPTATVDVKKWLKQRYSSGMRNRNLASDPEVTERIESIRNDIDAGRMGAAAGKIEDLKTGINKANFYISSQDLMVLNQLNNMVK